MTSYASTKEVFEYLRWNKKIPTFKPGTTPLPETVDDSGTSATASLYYLDHNKVIDNTLTLSFGTSSTATTALIKDTDYTIDLDTGRIILNLAGLDKIGTDKIYAEYQYNDMIENSVISTMIDRNQAYLNKSMRQSFGTAILVSKEEQMGRGVYDRMYRVRNLPLNIAKTQIDKGLEKTYFITDGTAITATTVVTVVTVEDNSGFKINDIITIGKELMEVTNIIGGTALHVTRGYPTGSANFASHGTATQVINMAVEISNTPVGDEPTYNTLEFRDDFEVDSDIGAVQLLHISAEDKDELAPDVFPLYKTFNRIRLSYRYGDEKIPKDIEQATILLVAKDLIDSALAKSLPEGIDGFSPATIAQIDNRINKLINKRKVLLSGGF